MAGNELKEKLKTKLKEIWDDYDFIIGTISYLKDDEDIQSMLDYLDEPKEKDLSQISLHALHLYQLRNEEILVDDFGNLSKEIEVK